MLKGWKSSMKTGKENEWKAKKVAKREEKKLTALEKKTGDRKEGMGWTRQRKG